MFRQHAWEAGSSWTGDGLIRFVASDDPVAVRIRRETIVKIMPLCDPDGVAHGGVRFNRNGYDLNRNWDLVDPAKMPEIAAERRAILDWVDAGKRVDFFLTVHNTETNEYLNGPPDSSRSPAAVAGVVNSYGLKARRLRQPSGPFRKSDYNRGQAWPYECGSRLISRPKATGV